MHYETLEVQKRVLGPKHPDTLNTATNLASALDDQEQHAAAAAMNRETLEVQKRVLGQEHPDIMITADNFAIMLREQGQHAEVCTA